MAKKREHSLVNCKACYHYFPEVTSFYPVNSTKAKIDSKENPFNVAQDFKPRANLAATLKDATQKINNVLSPSFQSVYQITFAEAMAKYSRTGLRMKCTKQKRKQETRDSHRNAKNQIETSWSATSVDRCYGSRQSFSARQEERLNQSFESKDDAKNRVLKRKKQEQDGLRKPKKHCGNFVKMSWDKQGLLTEVSNLPDETEINWSELAGRYNVTNKKGEVSKNGGQIVQDWLISQGENIHRFNLKRKADSEIGRIRRKKLRGPGGKISLPCEEPVSAIKERMKQKLEASKYSVGEIIVPRRYEKLVLENKQIVKKFILLKDVSFHLQISGEMHLKITNSI